MNQIHHIRECTVREYILLMSEEDKNWRAARMRRCVSFLRAVCINRLKAAKPAVPLMGRCQASAWKWRSNYSNEEDVEETPQGEKAPGGAVSPQREDTHTQPCKTWIQAQTKA